MKADFTKKLMKWNRDFNIRAMPWKGEKDPYKIWLSEIILQQTRVEQGLGYYQRFVETFPTVQDLAAAPEKKVFKLWEGLGYYTRCKNLIATAAFISKEKKGKFPDEYESILSLKGIGPYTASAIASFAFNLPHAVTDGNVFRVLSRYFGISTPIDSNAGKKLYQLLAFELLDKQHPGIYNQAIMDFGAVICKPQQPLCEQCPQKNDCQALKYNIVKTLPVKEKQLKKKTRWLYYFILHVKDAVLVRKRTSKDIWENLYEFVLFESDELLAPGEKTLNPLVKKIFGNKAAVRIKNISPVFRQQLTHQTIIGQFIELETPSPPDTLKDYELVKKSLLINYPFPKFITAYLQKQSKPMQLF
ncbi:MAG TPA: A/G-specific adenine glycosylase [Chitinophagaceae bacterium]|nr:A/G-specific adenine glycosylase [Chitinophagaceae bacterium]